ncbi:MAG: hypothetical protein ACFFDW_04105 [Candidatus Thorarchaeota archaeon]
MSDLNENQPPEETSEYENSRVRIEIDGKIDVSEEINDKKALRHIKNVVKDYEDYLTVLNRRKSDANFCNYVSQQIIATSDQMKEIHALLIEKQQMSTWAIAERLINDFASFIRYVEKRDYGFTTFFENPKLLEIDISQLYLIEFDIVETLKMMRERTSSFMKMVSRDYLEDIDLWMETLDRMLGRIIRLFDDRAKLIGSYERIS